MVPKLRVARPTNDLAPLLRFYRDGLGLTEIGGFTNHEGFDGLILGHLQAPYHLEFTVQHGHPATLAPSAEHLLVFYLPDRLEWQAAAERLQALDYAPVVAYNPYWDRQGLTFQAPDGYRVVLQNTAWDY
jgi:catechol 2,3-dioxygenase-like lactoylglutathione lyase family enzyme